MDSELREALVFLGFVETNHVPKLKDITKMFHRLALKLHPDKNNGSKEATALFQQLLMRLLEGLPRTSPKSMLMKRS